MSTDNLNKSKRGAILAGDGWTLLDGQAVLRYGDQTARESLLASRRFPEGWLDIDVLDYGKTVALALANDMDADERLFRRRIADVQPFPGISHEDWASIRKEQDEWQARVDAGAPRCQYGNEGGPCRSPPKANGWCEGHQHVAALRGEGTATAPCTAVDAAPAATIPECGHVLVTPLPETQRLVCRRAPHGAEVTHRWEATPLMTRKAPPCERPHGVYCLDALDMGSKLLVPCAPCAAFLAERGGDVVECPCSRRGPPVRHDLTCQYGPALVMEAVGVQLYADGQVRDTKDYREDWETAEVLGEEHVRVLGQVSQALRQLRDGRSREALHLLDALVRGP